MPIVTPEWPVWASNFYPGCGTLQGWATAEHAFQAMKTLNADERLRIKLAATPNEAKQLGRSVTLRPSWEDIKEEVMLSVIRRKFAQGTELAQKLKAHQGQLVEMTNWHDITWGVCNGQCKSGPHDLYGDNKLGLILMQVRRELMV